MTTVPKPTTQELLTGATAPQPLTTVPVAGVDAGRGRSGAGSAPVARRHGGDRRTGDRAGEAGGHRRCRYGQEHRAGAVRDTLREAGTPVVTRAPQPGDPAGAAVVIDDAHLLSGDELGRLTELAGEQDTTLVIATEPRDQDGDLRALTVAIERQRPRLALGPLTAGEAARLLTDPSGHPPPADLVATLMTATGGIPALVSAVIAAPRPHAAPAITQGALFALIERLRRLDEAELDALLITSLSSGIGCRRRRRGTRRTWWSRRACWSTGSAPPDWSSPRTRPGSCDRCTARSRRSSAPPATTTWSRPLLRTQAEMSTLSTELALRLAEHGVRDPRLADLLRRHAGAVRGDTALTVRVYRAAVEAGATELRARLADASAPPATAPPRPPWPTTCSAPTTRPNAPRPCGWPPVSRPTTAT